MEILLSGGVDDKNLKTKYVINCNPPSMVLRRFALGMACEF